MNNQTNIPSNIEQIIFGEPDTDDYKEYEKGQDVFVTINTSGWKRIVKFMNDLVDGATKEFNTSRKPAPELAQQRDKKIFYEEFRDAVLSEVEAVSQIPQPK
jgi:hypothetical protein